MIYDWNPSDRVALVDYDYVPMERCEVADLTPIRECYLQQRHYVARVRQACGGRDVVGLVVPPLRPFVAERWVGGVRPWDVLPTEETDGKDRRVDR
jgi:hypothetical protein